MQFRSAATTTSKPAQQTKPKPTATATSAKKGNITYHVQILSASKPIPTNSKEFRGLKNVKYYRSGNSYRYYVGEGRSFKEMSGLLRDVKKKFPDAFVVKLIDYQPYR
jgi:N-acetylmuramoyl-L-alanine amidase